ncbi:vezatin isoform X2 [Parambassis ranga]|uniref:Vezatin n=1 Tax=Parambassis ranga TaxID=210632 RepID=A0A6P7I637_9TELE|nr:vezatin isoform X2 [Parambassis ranga]
MCFSNRLAINFSAAAPEYCRLQLQNAKRVACRWRRAMTEEFDEDVVFENSPLFQYLHDLGHTDFEACPTASQEEEYGGQEEDPTSPGEDSQNTAGGCLWRLAEALWRWSPIYPRAASRKQEQQLDCVFGQYSVRCILDQDVLLQEDVELIELLDPSLLTLGSSPSGSPSRASSLPRPSLIATPSLWDMAGLVGLAAVLLGLCSVSEGLWSLAAAPWGMALLGWVVLRGITLWRRGRMQRAVHTRATQLQILVHNSKTLTGLSRKALRLVQETEVISRGFTLVSAASSFSRAGPGVVPRGQQLIGLRKALYRALRSAFRASRRATCHMLKAFPLNSEIDNVTNYVSAVPLKELGLGLGIEHLGDEQAQELTDDYSLPALKMLFQLWVGQSSECFRRLALLLSPRRLDEAEEYVTKVETSPSASPLPPLHRSIAAVTEPLHHALASCLGEVQRSYDFHRHFETQPRMTGCDRTGRAREKCRELNTLHTSIRSLQLHLKALLSEMIILEDDLEKLMVSKELTELTLEGYQDLSDRLHQLQPHMQASTGCWEDTISQVERMLKRANTCPGSTEGVEQCGPPEFKVPAPPPSYPLILDRDPVPEELEWEAYVSDSDSDSEGQGSWTDMLSPEERERQRREREESRRVLSELKAVLGFRASEGERMKRKQLLFNDQAALTPSALTDSSDPATNLSGAPTSVGPVDIGNEEGNHLSERSAGNKGEEGEGKDSRVRPDPSADPVTEFSCGLEGGDMGGTSFCSRGGGGASELHQYDGVAEEAEGQNGLDCFLKPKVLAVSLMDRLTEIHGSEALSFSSTLAAQVAARSQSLINMEEQTFGDEEEEEDDEEEAESDRPTLENDKTLKPSALSEH